MRRNPTRSSTRSQAYASRKSPAGCPRPISRPGSGVAHAKRAGRSSAAMAASLARHPAPRSGRRIDRRKEPPMTENPQIAPYVFYEDVGAAIDFLVRAFGFRERMRMTGDDRTILHAEVELGDGVVMMGCPPDYRNPKRLGQVTVGMYVRVDDVDSHYERAKAAGAEIERPPSDQNYGDRNYGAIDPEGHQWWFSMPVRMPTG